MHAGFDLVFANPLNQPQRDVSTGVALAGKFYPGCLSAVVLKNNRGKVNLVYHHFNRGPQDVILSTAAECAGEQGKFWPMFDAMFSDTFQGAEKAARSISLNMKSYKSCVSSSKYSSLIQEHTKRGVDFGITGTPGYVINGKTQVGYKPGPSLDAEIKSAL